MTIGITGANGQTVTLTSHRAGNFDSSQPVTPPLNATVTTNSGSSSMTTADSTSACNSCHKGGGPPGGKLYAP